MYNLQLRYSWKQIIVDWKDEILVLISFILDAMTVIAFLKHYGLDKDYKVNLILLPEFSFPSISWGQIDRFSPNFIYALILT